MLLKKEKIMLVLLPAWSSSRFFRSHDDRRDNSMLIPLHPCRKKNQKLENLLRLIFFLAFEAENAANEVEEEIIRMSVRSFSSIRKSIKSSFIKVTATL